MNKKLKDFLINTAIALAGVGLAVGIFFLLQNYTRNRELNNLIPRAENAIDHKEYSLAINLFMRAENELPKNDARLTKVKLNLANLYFTKGRYDDALKYYDQLDSKNLTSEEYENIGEIYLKQNNLDKTVEFWSKANLSPSNRLKFAQIYYDRNDFDNYFAQLDHIQNYKEPLLLKQIKEADLTNVLLNIDKAKTLDSISTDNVDIELFRSQIDNAKKQSDNNKKEFAELIQISAYSDLNQCRLLLDRIVSLRKTLESKKIPTSQLDFYEGKCFNQVGRVDEAIILLDKSIKFDPTIIAYRESLARSYFLKNDKPKIQEIYKNIIVIEKSSKHYENLGYYMYKLKEYDDALSAYNEALNIVSEVSDKARISEIILEISLRDKKNLEVCKNEALLQNISSIDTSESMLLKGHCAIYMNKEYSIDAGKYSFIVQYLDALKKKDKDAIDKILDKDLDGLVTTYFEAVGTQIIK